MVAHACATILIQRKHICACKPDTTAAGHIKARQQSQQGGFTRTGSADYGQALARRHLEIDFVQDDQRQLAT